MNKENNKNNIIKVLKITIFVSLIPTIVIWFVVGIQKIEQTQEKKEINKKTQKILKEIAIRYKRLKGGIFLDKELILQEIKELQTQLKAQEIYKI